MPPRKRARTSQVASHSPQSHTKSATPEPSSPIADHPLCALWTDEEEVGLFKGLIKWKPTGYHKHFNLLALYQYLLTNGYIHPRNEHTKPSGIWHKLHSLYDLEALDLREDARQLSDLSDDESLDRVQEAEKTGAYYSLAVNKLHNSDFTLPDDQGFPELLWQQRFPAPDREAAESPPLIPELNLASVAPIRFTPSFSVEPDDISMAPAKRGRGRPKGRKNIRPTLAAETSTSKRRSSRKVESVTNENEDEAVEVESEKDESEDGDELQAEDQDEEGEEDAENDGEPLDSVDGDDEDPADSPPPEPLSKKPGRRKALTRTSTRTRGKAR